MFKRASQQGRSKRLSMILSKLARIPCPRGGSGEFPTARVQRGPSEGARCASTGDSPGDPSLLADFFSIPLNEQLRFRVRGQRNNGGQPHDFVDILFDCGTVHAHVFQTGAAGDQTKPPDVFRVLKHF